VRSDYERFVDELKQAAKTPPPRVAPTTIPPETTSTTLSILDRQVQSLDLQRQAQARCKQLLASVGPQPAVVAPGAPRITGLRCEEHQPSTRPNRSRARSTLQRRK
jgi:hypothetical protein